jgi:endoribonuclease Dicer
MTKELVADAGVVQDLLPRRYQEEIFARAQQANVIAALGTGSGKTFISTLLIKWIASKESCRDKVIVFLVPKVTLVEQQGEFIAKHTPLRVLKLHGALHMQMADQVGWKKRFQQHDVFVMTGMTLSRYRLSALSFISVQPRYSSTFSRIHIGV